MEKNFVAAFKTSKKLVPAAIYALLTCRRAQETTTTTDSICAPRNYMFRHALCYNFGLVGVRERESRRKRREKKWLKTRGDWPVLVCWCKFSRKQFFTRGKITLESCGNLLNGNYRLWLIEFKLNSISSIAAN